MEFRRRLAVRRHLKDDFYAIDDALFAGLTDEIVRREKRHGAACDRLTERRIHLAANALRQAEAKLILRAPRHGVAGDDIFRHGKIEEFIRRDDLNTSRGRVFLREDTPDTAPMIRMGVGINDRNDRSFSALPKI